MSKRNKDVQKNLEKYAKIQEDAVKSGLAMALEGLEEMHNSDYGINSLDEEKENRRARYIDRVNSHYLPLIKDLLANADGLYNQLCQRFYFSFYAGKKLDEGKKVAVTANDSQIFKLVDKESGEDISYKAENGIDYISDPLHKEIFPEYSLKQGDVEKFLHEVKRSKYGLDFQPINFSEFDKMIERIEKDAQKTETALNKQEIFFQEIAKNLNAEKEVDLARFEKNPTILDVVVDRVALRRNFAKEAVEDRQEDCVVPDVGVEFARENGFLHGKRAAENGESSKRNRGDEGEEAPAPASAVREVADHGALKGREGVNLGNG